MADTLAVIGALGDSSSVPALAAGCAPVEECAAPIVLAVIQRLFAFSLGLQGARRLGFQDGILHSRPRTDANHPDREHLSSSSQAFASPLYIYPRIPFCSLLWGCGGQSIQSLFECCHSESSTWSRVLRARGA